MFALFSLGQFIFTVKEQDEGLQGDWLCYGMYYTSVVMVSEMVLEIRMSYMHVPASSFAC